MASQHEFHVSPGGDDRGDGSADRPFATLQQALDAARAAGTSRPRRIVLHDGTWYETSLELTAADNGLTMAAAAGASPRLVGGRRIADWREIGGGLWAADVPAVRSGEWGFRMLSVAGRFAPRARLPQTGRLKHESVFDVRWMSTTAGGWERKPTEDELTTMVYSPGDLGDWLETRNAELQVFHAWDESVVGIRSLDTATRTIRFSNPAGHPPGGFANWNAHAREYVVWNVREGLTRPGQWYLDRAAGRVVYWPLAGEDMTNVEVLAPTAEAVIRIAGSEAEPVRGVSIEGLRVTVAGTPLEAGGFGAMKFAGAVSAEYAEDCRFERLGVFAVGGQGIKLTRCPRAVVSRCHVHDCGAGGVIVAGAGSRVEDCHVHDVGLAYPSALGVRSGGDDCVIAHNHIHHTGYSGINAGGGSGTRIEYNRIHHVMRDLEDGACIYITFCKRYTMRGNVAYGVRDVQAHAYYVDEQGDDCVVEGNLAVGLAWPLHNHMAHDGIIRNNVCVCDGPVRLTFPKSERFVFEHNVIVAAGDIVIAATDEALASMPGNVLHAGDGKVVRRASGWIDQKETPLPLPAADGTVFADPKVRVDADAGTVTFAPDSPAAAAGIVALDLRDAGPRAEG